MRNVTFGACPQQPTSPFDKWVQDCLTKIQTSSRQDQVTNVGNSGQALLSITNATANTIPLFTSATAAKAISCTVIAQTFLAETSTGAMLAFLGGQTGSAALLIANNLSDVASAPASRVNLNVETHSTNGDSDYSIKTTDRVLATSATLTAPRTWTLPSAAGVNPGQTIIIVDEFNGITSTNTVTLAVQSGQKLNTTTNGTYVLSATGSVLVLESDGVSNWSYASQNNYATLFVKNNAVLTVAGSQNLTGGFTETPFSNGVFTSGTLTCNPSACLKQVVINNGPFAITPSTQVGDVELYVTNSGSASTITFSNWTKQWTGDAFDATSGHEFVVFLYGFQNEAGSAKSAYLIKAMQ